MLGHEHTVGSPESSVTLKVFNSCARTTVEALAGNESQQRGYLQKAPNKRLQRET